SEEAGACRQRRYREKPRAGGWRDRFVCCVHSAGGASSAETRLGEVGGRSNLNIPTLPWLKSLLCSP
ncbi:unnamed protein product, partial [Gulo gulo]